jgi:hypothetical protein
MPTTSNFGWTTPADTDLVKDGASAIRTLGNNIDASLVDLKGGTTNQVLAKNSNSDLDFKWVADASGIPATIFDAKGDLLAASAADTAARLAVGSNGQVLSANSATATGLEWIAAPSGAIKQVVFAEYSTATATNTTTLTDIGLSATITPSSTSSRILIMTQASYSVSDTGQTDIGVKAALLRGATIIVDKPTASAGYFNLASNTAGKGLGGVVTLLDYDDPATTSATTYKFQGASYDSTDCTWQPNSGKSTMILIEVLF